MSALQIAVTANLNSDSSVHSATFKRAVGMAADRLREFHGVEVELDWVNDHASPVGGQGAAEQILRSGAAAVVGHYASGAALAAAPLYSAAGRPLLLPAATAEQLTVHPGVYRICDSDRDYADWIGEQLAALGVRRVFVGTDGSSHAESVRQGLQRALPPERRTGNIAEADALLFSGMFEASLAFARDRLGKGDRRLLFLTDDAQSDRLAEAIDHAPATLLVMGFCTAPATAPANAMADAYRRRWGKLPGIYFFETVAAIEIAGTWLRDGDRRCPVETILGPVAFNARGESRPRRFACYRAVGQSLVKIGHRELTHV